MESGDARASLLPADDLSYSYELSFPVIGEQYFEFAFSRAGFRAEIAPARTFGFLKELEALNQMNMAKGASLANTLALDDSGVVNREHPALCRRIRPPQDPGRHRRHGAGRRTP